jgi:hypothetical protein
MKKLTSLQNQQITGGMMVMFRGHQPPQPFLALKRWFQGLGTNLPESNVGRGAKYNPSLFRRN